MIKNTNPVKKFGKIYCDLQVFVCTKHVTQDELQDSNSLVDFTSLSFSKRIWFFCGCFSILVFCLNNTFLGTGVFSSLTAA